jgi:hypothetical protein
MMNKLKTSKSMTKMTFKTINEQIILNKENLAINNYYVYVDQLNYIILFHFFYF